MKRLLTIASLLVATWVAAQDPQFTQFYAAPTYLNPAFAGTTTQSRISGNYRLQWPGIPGAFRVENIAFDRYLPSINSGMGFLMTREKMGTGGLQNLTFGYQYAYEARITRELFFRPALQFGFTQRSINFGDLIFNDQLIRPDGVATLENPILDPVTFFDLSGGAILNTSTWWLGFSAHHLNEPDESLYGNNPAFLFRRYSLHGGYRLKLRKKFKHSRTYAVAAFNYRAQGDFDQLDAGAYLELDPFVFGIWYRSLPIKSNREGYFNHDAINMVVGFHAGSYKFGYSYDITVSPLNVGQSAGSHELSLSYAWANKRDPRLSKRRIIPCAKF